MVERARARAPDAGTRSAEAALADPAAAAVVADGAERLGLVLAALVNALDPGAVVIGGGLGLHDGYRARVTAALRAGGLRRGRARAARSLPAALGADAAVIGAALAAGGALAARARPGAGRLEARAARPASSSSASCSAPPVAVGTVIARSA